MTDKFVVIDYNLINLISLITIGFNYNRQEMKLLARVHVICARQKSR